MQSGKGRAASRTGVALTILLFATTPTGSALAIPMGQQAGPNPDASGDRAPPTAKDRALSDRLFREGKQLYDAGKYKEACDALAKSDELDPAIGTLGLLAACHEKKGELVLAWKEYVETARRADAKKDSRAEYAKQQADTLRQKLAELTIRSVDPAGGLTITRDGDPVSADEIGTGALLTPGEHTITAGAAGRKEWRLTVTLKEGESRAVEIPALQPAEPVSVASGPPRWLAWVFGGVGVVGIGVGATAGALAISNNDASLNKKTCPPTAEKCGPRDTALTSATVSTVGFVVGGAGVAAGVVLFVLSSGGSTDATTRRTGAKASVSTHVAPMLGPGEAGAVLVGSF